MTASDRKPGFFTRLGQWVTRIRIILSNLLFFLLLTVVLVLLFSSVPAPQVPDGGALVLDPKGAIVEERTPIDPLQQWLTPQAVVPETTLSDLLEALDHARDDDRIAMAVLDLDDLQFVSTVHASAVGDAVRRFRESGKQVIAYGSFFDQQPYLMATHADAVYMHPLGQVLIQGYAINQLYFNELLEKLDVNVHVFRAGRYKEFVEPYIRNDMSPEAREANAELVGSLWQAYADRVIANRDLEADRFERYAGSYDQAVVETDGDFARLAVEYHLVDELLTPDQARVRVADTVGHDREGGFRGIDFRQYLVAVNGQETPRDERDRVGVITAQGPIMMGERIVGGIAADEMVDMIRGIRQDDDIRALVLRLDTPGGSAFASELIRQELELLQLAGKPVVVSMGPVAASGGYWVSATADSIVAEPTTLTGSIGVFGILPTFEDSLTGIGITSDGVSTSDLGLADPLRGLSESAARVLQTGTDHTYQRFTHLVARGRGLTPEQVENVAQGRVWLGSRALDLGLVDSLGDLSLAIDKAAELAQLTDYQVQRIEPPLSPRERLLRQLTGNLSWAGQWLGAAQSSAMQDSGGAALGVLPPVVRELGQAWEWLGSLDDPRHSYALCLVCPPGR